VLFATLERDMQKVQFSVPKFYEGIKTSVGEALCIVNTKCRVYVIIGYGKQGEAYDDYVVTE
jgi:hypothetical protein